MSSTDPTQAKCSTLERGTKSIETALMGGVGYYHKIPPDLSKRILPLTALPRKGVKYIFTPATEVILRQTNAELAAPSILVFPVWDAVADGCRPFHVYCGACIEGFGAA